MTSARGLAARAGFVFARPQTRGLISRDVAITSVRPSSMRATHMTKSLIRDRETQLARRLVQVPLGNGRSNSRPSALRISSPAHCLIVLPTSSIPRNPWPHRFSTRSASGRPRVIRLTRRRENHRCHVTSVTSAREYTHCPQVLLSAMFKCYPVCRCARIESEGFREALWSGFPCCLAAR